MQVLAYLVDYPHIFDQRLGFITREHQRRIYLQRTELAVVASARGCDGGYAKGGKASELGVTRALVTVDSDAAPLQQTAEQLGGELGWILDGERLIGSGVIERHIAPEGKHCGTRFTVDEDLSARACGSGDDAIVDAVVVRERGYAYERTFSGSVGGQNVYEDDVVIDGERGNRCAIGPDEVILAPTLSIALKGEVRIVGDDVTIYVFHPFLYQRVGEVFQNLDRVLVSLRAQVVGQFSSGEVGITSTDQEEISCEAAVAVQSASGFNRGVELVIGTDQCECGGGSEELSIRRRGKQLVGVLGVKRASGGERYHFNAPETAGEVGVGEHGS